MINEEFANTDLLSFISNPQEQKLIIFTKRPNWKLFRRTFHNFQLRSVFDIINLFFTQLSKSIRSAYYWIISNLNLHSIPFKCKSSHGTRVSSVFTLLHYSNVIYTGVCPLKIQIPIYLVCNVFALNSNTYKRTAWTDYPRVQPNIHTILHLDQQ